MFLFRPARRGLRYDFNSESGLTNLNRLAETELQTLPHSDTLAYLLKDLSPHSLDLLRRPMVRRLLRSRCLERFRLFDRFYLVAVHGTGYLSFQKPPCDQCLRETLSAWREAVLSPLLEAKLICANGLAISLGTEFLQNRDGQDRQDCELKAFSRILPGLTAASPQLPLCPLLDGLYLSRPVLSLVRKHRCEWIITFKEGALPEACSEFEALHALLAHQQIETTDDAVQRRWKIQNEGFDT